MKMQKRRHFVTMSIWVVRAAVGSQTDLLPVGAHIHKRKKESI